MIDNLSSVVFTFGSISCASAVFIINFIVTEEASCSINACKMNFEGARDALLIRL